VQGRFTEDDVDRLFVVGAAAHPAVVTTPAIRDWFGARAGAALAAHDPDARAVDLHLAAACTAGDAAAIAQLDASLPSVVRPALARLRLPASDDDEIVQRVRIALLSPGTSGEPGIAGYSGRGELRAYIRAIAVKLALKRREREGGPPASDDDPIELLPDSNDSPQLRLLKERCREDLRTAFAVALGELEPRERTLLRQHYLDGLTVDTLAPLHRVHRSTCARWIETARTKVLRGVRSHLRDALDLTPADLDSAIDLVRSQLDLSLSRHLAE
jgi:RNA polymerase sigma-70 factor (ECF subfamily)